MILAPMARRESTGGQLAVGYQFYLGIDGGATRCRARMRDASGALLTQIVGPAANIYVDYAGAVDVVRRIIAEALDRAGLGSGDPKCIALGIGLAGLSTGAEAARISADLMAIEAVASVRAANDAVTACLGAHAGADGGIIIAGTGSAGIARIAGREIVIGGRGFLLGDDGSAARIGADAVRAALRACDGLGVTTPLTQRLMQHFADDPHVALQWALTAKPSDYGAFAPAVLEAASRGDPIARPVVEAAAAAIAALAGAVRALGADRVALVGGLGDGIRQHLPIDFNRMLLQPLFDATDGAILLAGGVLPASPDGSEAAI
jgi:glucosamine kinase